MRFGLWTDDPGFAAVAAAAGVDRIGPDLERLGKAARQPGPGNLISGHDEACLPAVRAAVGGRSLFVRCNPPHDGLAAELGRLLAAGVTTVMLPMVRSPADAERAARCIDGRATLVAMVEHADALARVEDLAAVEGVDELYIGANDLARTLGRATRFGAVAPAIVGRVAAAAARRGRGFGFFGVGRLDDAGLPVRPDSVLAAFVAYDATSAWFARSFGLQATGFHERLDAVRARLASWAVAPDAERDAEVRRFFADCALADARAPGAQVRSRS